ncbi:MAG: helix-turn-helix transcriptional regulator [Oscillospiraceae bacterium]|nr:helix-turn-helix transcriptional regulator [Oscillospiraceae bacterium]
MKFERLRTLRKEYHLTQKQVAEYLGCSQQTYSRLENRNIVLPARILIALAEFYHTNADYIVGLTDIRRPYSDL